MLTVGVILSFLFYSVSGAGHLVILQSPDAVSFSGSDSIDSQLIPDIFSASVGFSIDQSNNWQGITLKNPFDFAQALVVVAVDGVSSLGEFKDAAVFPIEHTQEESVAWHKIEENLRIRRPNVDNNSLLRVELGQEEANIEDIKTKHLDASKEEDALFLQSLAELESHINRYKKSGVLGDTIPTVNWFALSTIHTLSDIKGPKDSATVEAKHLVRDAIIKLGKAAKEATGNRALVAAIISDGSHTRHVRALEGNNTAPGNRATIYTEDYPVIFNIILWFSVAFIFALIAVSYFIADMDPGRDSIIYRMTSNRMKKDS